MYNTSVVLCCINVGQPMKGRGQPPTAYED